MASCPPSCSTGMEAMAYSWVPHGTRGRAQEQQRRYGNASRKLKDVLLSPEIVFFLPCFEDALHLSQRLRILCLRGRTWSIIGKT